MKQLITILWSTWSIGTQSLDIISKHQDEFEIYALAAKSNIDLLYKQVEVFKPKVIVIFEEIKANEFKSKYKFNWEILSGMEGLTLIVSKPDIIINALVGNIWVIPTITALKHWKVVALANKETMVCAWTEINDLIKKHWWTIRPIDSEHSAIWQCLRSGNKSELKKIILTASWWPFRTWPKSKIAIAQASEAIKHPNWNMWVKISIDSATLANKWLEFIEAKYLFDLADNQIEVVIHPESIIHSAVEFQDWSIIAELWACDMRRAISYAIFNEQRINSWLQWFSFFWKNLSFELPDEERFPCLSLAKKASLKWNKYCQIFNDTNEKAVQLYLNGQIWFYDISNMISSALERDN